MPRWPRRWASTPSFPRSKPAHAQAASDGLKWRHGVSTFGDIKYPAGFKRFDYVNPDAPKGGVVRLFELGTFDNFNIVIDGLKGSIPAGIARIYQTLTTRPPTSRTATMACWRNSSAIPTISPT